MAFDVLREKTPCWFLDGLSQQEFEALALKQGKAFKRITDIAVIGAVVHCTVESQSHISEWNFSVDFNDWGHVTGTFWIRTDNSDSVIPHAFGTKLSKLIQDELTNRQINLRDLSSDVDRHKDLGQLITTGINIRRDFWTFVRDEILGKKRQISIAHSNIDLQGQHLYPVFAQLIDDGFEQIVAQTVKDADDHNLFYEYEVDSVSIDGLTSFQCGESFDHNAQVVIKYHMKKEIILPFDAFSLIRQNYRSVTGRLQAQGFTMVHERQIRDLVTGFLIKDGSTEKVVVERPDSTESLIQSGKAYPYDTPIIVYYHTFR